MERQALGSDMAKVNEQNQHSFDFPPASRFLDPGSSHEAEEEITASGKRAAHCRIIIAVLDNENGLTSKEISTRCALDRHQVARRMPDIENSKAVKRGPSRICRVENKGTAVTWWLI